MSFQAMAWADIGDEVNCSVCSKSFVAEFAYERMGVCAHCVKRLAHHYSVAHSGAPAEGFSDPQEIEDYYSAKQQSYRKSRIGAKLRTQVFERDAYRCKQCGSYHNLHVDHIFPESKGGATRLDNLQTLCASCNIAKGAKS